MATMEDKGNRDASNGYDAVADEFIARRSAIGADTVISWSRTLPPECAILDIGCGHGVPIAEALLSRGFELYGIDASRRLVQAFQQRFPDVNVAHERVETSSFFNRNFHAAIAIGLIFLLDKDEQIRLIRRVAHALVPGGKLLFTAPKRACTWNDALTGRLSRSLGIEYYKKVASTAGFVLIGTKKDEGDNDYLEFVKVDTTNAI